MRGNFFDEAWSEALARHAGQMYGKHQYEYHLNMVVARTREIYGNDSLQLAAAALHDTIEDTGATREYLEDKYGTELATLVWTASADPAETSRRGKQQSIANKLAILPEHLRIRGIDLKMTDRNCNMKASMQEQRWDLVRMYQGEEGLYLPHFSQGTPALFQEYRTYCAFVCPKH
jgi:(p)ppGpp synthase/HD superfamily hydrolase